MQRPPPSGTGVELEGALEQLDISRDHHQTPQHQPQSQPQPPQGSREPSSAGSDQQARNQAGSSGSQPSGQLGGVLKTSHEEVWYLKSIEFTSPSGVTRTYNVITQNYNGCVLHCSDSFFLLHTLTYNTTDRPCSFIAICNILILREQIEILPRGRKSVSYEFLAQLVGEHILLTAPDAGVSAALSMMPLTTSELHSSSAQWQPVALVN
jgi:ubiquitin carboxyl-terminal hydrolase MINDY-1/2